MTETSKEYAQALFSLATECGKQEAIADSLQVMADAFAEQPEYLLLLGAPSLPKAERQNAIEAAFGSLEEYAVSFLMRLIDGGRLDAFADCVNDYRELLRAATRQAVAKVTAAAPLTEEEADRLTEKLERMTGRKITLQVQVDRSLLAGLVVEVDGRVLDGSLKNRLKEMKEGIDR